MKLAPEILPNFKTANEESEIKENSHTFGSYSFATYCEEKANDSRKKYMDENFDLVEDVERGKVFGPHNGCKECFGTGWMPSCPFDKSEPLRSLWVQAQIDQPAEDGFHLVPCPHCNPVHEGVLDEHIVKQGSEFVLKSKKSGKSLGKYPSKAGAQKREGQVEYFKKKEIHEGESVLPGDSGDDKKKTDTNNKTDKEHSDAKQKAQNARDKDPNKKQKSEQERKKKEQERTSKKLLPYEFTSQDDAERAAGHLGLQGSHPSGNGIYKPGTSDQGLRDAVARKKQKQKMRGGKGGFYAEANDTTDPYPIDKCGIHESTLSVIKKVIFLRD